MRILAATLLFFCLNAVRAQDVLVIAADAGAFPTGTSQTLAYASGSIRVSSFGDGLQIQSPVAASPSWSIILRPPSSMNFAAGCYERAKRFPDLGRPEIDFSFGSSGCNNAFGRYRILEIQRDGGGDVTSLAVDFSQQCERYGKAVQGKIRFNSALPDSGPHLRSVTDQTGTLTFAAAPGAIGATAPGGSANISMTRLNSYGASNFENGASLTYAGPLPGGVANGSWTLNFAAAGDAPISTGSFQNATRYPFQLATEPGLNFSYNGAGCNTLFGSFDITRSATDALDKIPLQLTATFQQRCNSTDGALTSGSIVFDANPLGPTVAPSSTLLFSGGFESGELPPISYFSSTCSN